MSDVQQGEPAESSSVPVVVTSRNVSASELAAVSAVVQGLLAEEGDARRAAESRGQSAWQRSQRSLRGTVEPGPGRWNG
ncbi:acyl-CoA carboxylase subunit epsilon [Subtercola boreus]|uniref:Uncharacterized protein n=1 Tax=Subtercola boreus TaxID=120213 RepID=A0A3E0WCU6_9MICO|nr:acyl-CoA carboxylase subunit epsilon [Subtercola boreus]RFA22615.1 hypothetical protein B7R24_03090 [Subtercola boreus]RFA22971.1 hypothetical protein B7R23_03085 [Subtercola boreus]RFA28722.1 hypothetical protein B7R25_03100 [Subtercola boreus]